MILVSVALIILACNLTRLSVSGPMRRHSQRHFRFRGSVSRENVLSPRPSQQQIWWPGGHTRTLMHLIFVNEGSCFQFVIDGSSYFSIMFKVQLLLVDPRSFVYSFFFLFFIYIYIIFSFVFFFWGGEH